MSEDRPPLGWRSRLIHSEAKAPGGFKSLATPVWRGSTVVFHRLADARDDWDGGYTYGLYGTPTTLELARRIAELEGARHSFMVPGGQAAIALIFLACAGPARTCWCRTAPTARPGNSPWACWRSWASRSRPTPPWSAPRSRR